MAELASLSVCGEDEVRGEVGFGSRVRVRDPHSIGGSRVLLVLGDDFGCFQGRCGGGEPGKLEYWAASSFCERWFLGGKGMVTNVACRARETVIVQFVLHNFVTLFHRGSWRAPSACWVQPFL